MTRILSILAVALLAIGAGTYFFVSQPGGPVPGLATMAEAQGAETETEGETAEADGAVEIVDYVMGDPDAPVTLVEYGSFTCPHCKDFHLGPLKRIKEEYIDTGKVKLIYREVYFDRFGLWAAMVARCGGEEGYFGLVDLLYEQQQEWLAGSDVQAIANNLRRIGRTAGFSDEELDACLTNQAKAEAMIAHYQENVTADGVDSTPSFVIGGTTYKNMPYEEMAELLDAELDE